MKTIKDQITETKALIVNIKVSQKSQHTGIQEALESMLNLIESLQNAKATNEEDYV